MITPHDCFQNTPQLVGRRESTVREFRYQLSSKVSIAVRIDLVPDVRARWRKASKHPYLDGVGLSLEGWGGNLGQLLASAAGQPLRKRTALQNCRARASHKLLSILCQIPLLYFRHQAGIFITMPAVSKCYITSEGSLYLTTLCFEESPILPWRFELSPQCSAQYTPKFSCGNIANKLPRGPKLGFFPMDYTTPAAKARASWLSNC